MSKSFISNQLSTQLVNSNNELMPKRRKLRVNGAVLTDDPTNDQTVLGILGGGGGSGTISVYENGLLQGAASELNFTGASQDTSFTSPRATIDLSPALVKDEGILVTGLREIDFSGAGVTVTQTAVNKTLITIPGGGTTTLARKIGGVLTEQVLPGNTTYRQYLLVPGSASITFTAPDFGIWFIFASIELGIPSAAGGTRIRAVVSTSPTDPVPVVQILTPQNMQSCPSSDLPDPFDWTDQGDIKDGANATVLNISAPLTLNWYVGQSQNSNPSDSIIIRNAVIYAFKLGDLP